MTSVKSFREAIEYLERLGLEVELVKTKTHLRFYCKKDGHERFFVKSASPSDKRATLNFYSDVRRWVKSLPTTTGGL